MSRVGNSLLNSNCILSYVLSNQMQALSMYSDSRMCCSWLNTKKPAMESPLSMLFNLDGGTDWVYLFNSYNRWSASICFPSQNSEGWISLHYYYVQVWASLYNQNVRMSHNPHNIVNQDICTFHRQLPNDKTKIAQGGRISVLKIPYVPYLSPTHRFCAQWGKGWNHGQFEIGICSRTIM